MNFKGGYKLLDHYNSLTFYSIYVIIKTELGIVATQLLKIERGFKMQIKRAIWDNIGIILIATIIYSFIFALMAPALLTDELKAAYEAGQSNEQLVLIIEAHDFFVPFAIFSIVEWVSIFALIIFIIRLVYRGIKGIPIL